MLRVIKIFLKQVSKIDRCFSKLLCTENEKKDDHEVFLYNDIGNYTKAKVMVAAKTIPSSNVLFRSQKEPLKICKL